MFVNVTACDPARARGTRMHAIITIRPKTGAENEVLGIGAHEPLGLKLRKGACRRMHWDPKGWMECYFCSGRPFLIQLTTLAWRSFVW